MQNDMKKNNRKEITVKQQINLIFKELEKLSLINKQIAVEEAKIAKLKRKQKRQIIKIRNNNNMKKQIKEMFKLQNKLNINTNGKEWIDGITKYGRKIDWFRCIYMETAEAIDSLNWKHWKDINKPNDIDNLKIEITDIWHFIMSQLIKEADGKKKTAVKRFIVARRDMPFSNRQSEPLELIKNLEAIMFFALKKDTSKILENFILIVESLQNHRLWSFEKLYELYIGKNCLNEFRQDNGYKDGTYIKIWNDKEDNVYMQDYIRNVEDYNYDSLYNYLSERYDEIKQNNDESTLLKSSKEDNKDTSNMTISS